MSDEAGRVPAYPRTIREWIQHERRIIESDAAGEPHAPFSEGMAETMDDLEHFLAWDYATERQIPGFYEGYTEFDRRTTPPPVE